MEEGSARITGPRELRAGCHSFASTVDWDGNEFSCLVRCDFVDRSVGPEKNKDDPRIHTNQHETKILPTSARCDFQSKPLVVDACRLS